MLLIINNGQKNRTFGAQTTSSCQPLKDSEYDTGARAGCDVGI
jgi:hypothetical protein